MKEEWKDIQGYEGLYQISNLGRVKSLKRFVNIKVFNKAQIKRVRKEYILNPVQDKDGYLLVHLYKSSKAKTFKVHRLVATNFLPLVINHKNGIKSDNKVSNLEWCTPKENMAHAINSLKYTPPKQTKAIICNETGQVFNSVQECAEYFNTHINCISRVLRKRRNSYKGYTFNYAES